MLESEKLIEFTETYFKALSTHKADSIKDLWHLDGLLLINYEKRPVEFLYQIPSFVIFELRTIQILTLDPGIGIIKAVWEMVMGNERGKHTSYISISLQDGKPIILSQIDFGSMN